MEGSGNKIENAPVESKTFFPPKEIGKATKN
jgi:hypothetical protein